MNSPWSETAAGTRLAVRVQPRSSRNAIGDIVNGELKIQLMAPPVDSAANSALCRFLAKKLACPPSAVSLHRGEKSRHKILIISELAPDIVAERLGGS